MMGQRRRRLASIELTFISMCRVFREGTPYQLMVLFILCYMGYCGYLLGFNSNHAAVMDIRCSTDMQR